MGWSESEPGCKRHPEVKQFSGAVCSSCLSERLSQLYAPSSLPVHSRSSNSHDGDESYYSSAASSSASASASPVRRGRGHHQRNASDVMMGSISFVLGGYGVMKKSRSIAVVPKSGGGGGGHSFGDEVVKSGGKMKNKKKRGFWSKLIGSTGKRTKQVLRHSKTTLR